MGLFDLESETLVIVDGKNSVFRNHYGHQGLKTSTGESTSVLYGFLQGLLTLEKHFSGSPIVVVWDGEGATWRHRVLRDDIKVEKVGTREPEKLGWMDRQVQQSIDFLSRTTPEPLRKEQPKSPVVGYKATRAPKTEKVRLERQVALEQIPELIWALEKLGMRNFKVRGLEGDDLIGILASAALDRKMFKKVVIHSSDTDFYQLINDDVQIFKGVEKGSGKPIWVTESMVMNKYGIRLKDWVKYRAITGDKSDNIPGFLPGVGPKTAKEWLMKGCDPSAKHFGDLPYLVRKDMETWKVPKLGMVNWESLWPRLRRNYLCSQILRDGFTDMLDTQVKERLDGTLQQLSKKNFLRVKKDESEKREFVEWLVKKEMPTLWERREQFQKLV